MRLKTRRNAPVWLIAILPILSIGVAFIFGAFFIIWAGESPITAYIALIKGSLGSTFAITESLARATPLIFTGLAAAVAFRAKFWNIGAEGQLYCGAMAATLVGTGVIDLPSPIMIPMLFIAGALGGCLILLVPVFLKTHMKVDEVVTTLLLNFVILLFVNMLLEGPWKDPMAMGWPQAARIIDSGVLPTIVTKSRLHLGIIIALLMSVVMWAILRFTVWGYEIRAVGYNQQASTFFGISINKSVLMVALFSGGLAGGVLPTIVAKSRLHFGIIIALVMSVVMWAILRFTVWGYEIRAVGYNQQASTFYGISINKSILMVALFSGGLAGMAGVSEVAGLKGYLTLTLSPGFGYTGIAVAMLAQLHPIGVIVSAIFLASIYVGADAMSRTVNIPNYIADILVAISLLSVLVGAMLTRFRIVWGK